MAEFSIVEVAREQLEAASHLLHAFFLEEGFDGDLELIRVRLQEMLEDAGCWAALAFDEEKAIGVATVSTNRGIEFGLQGEIGDLYVIPDYRRKGVAHRLVDESINWCRQSGCGSVQVTVTPEGDSAHDLRGFYRALNFSDSGRTFLYRQL